MLSRRSLITAGVCCCSMGLAYAQGQEHGCVSFESGIGTDSTLEQARFPGLSAMDFSQNYQNALAQVLTDISSLLAIDIAFGLYDDRPDNPNAGATNIALMTKFGGATPADGTVAIGVELVSQINLRSVANLGPALSAVIAHEAGHIIQFKYIKEQLSRLQHVTISAELHADFVCGYYAAFRKKREPRYPAALQAMTQFRYGDAGLVLVQHGTPDQRGSAVYAGFLLGQQERLGPADVAEQGLAYIESIDL